MPKKYVLALLGLVLGSVALTSGAEAQMYPYSREDVGTNMPDQAKLTELAKTLQNPVANLILVPFQNNFDFNLGDNDGFRYTMNFQPIIPIALTNRVLMISKTEMPIIAQNELGGTYGYAQGGLGDLQQSFFFTPRKAGSLIYGAGPVFRLPTATDKVLGSEKWAIGPTGVALTQQGPWTFGMLANYLISFAGEDDRPKYSRLLLQPFVAVVVGNAWAINVSTETTKDFSSDKWNAPLIAGFSKVMNLGRQTWGFGLNGKVAMNPNNGSESDWGIRSTATLLFPGREIGTRGVTGTAQNSREKHDPMTGLPQVVQSTLQAGQAFRNY